VFSVQYDPRLCNENQRTGIRREKEPASGETAVDRENILLEMHNTPIDHSLLHFAAPMSSIGSNHHYQNSISLQDEIRIRTPIKHQVSQCRLKM
jgi:hypothetical protein